MVLAGLVRRVGQRKVASAMDDGQHSLGASGLLAAPDGAELALILALGLLVLAAELINTCIETIVDHISPGKHPFAKKAKDCGSATVALTAIAGGVAWLVILLT